MRPALLIGTLVLVMASCGSADTPAARGEALVNDLGCVTCHTGSGNALGPSWVGLAGSQRTFTDGSTAVADDAYLREAIVDPSVRIVDGWRPAMPVFSLESGEIDDIVAYLRSLGSDASPAVPTMTRDDGRRAMSR